MISQVIDLKKTGKFSSLFLDYINGKDQLQRFTGPPPAIESFADQIKNKSFSAKSREILVKVLESQYELLSEVPESVKANIVLLKKDTTFTITTGHQLNLCTGPLYVIYKIATIIRACQELSAAYPDYDFVPLYWMASEDHDFDEIDHFNFNGNRYQWESEQRGAVGRFNLKDIKPLLGELSAIPSFFHTAYSGKWTLADAVRSYMNELFGQYGLVVLDPDNHEQKALFQPVMNSDILDHAFKEIVDKTSEEIESLGYKTQINARETNFFYVEDQLRSRIEEQDGNFAVIDTDLSFSRDEMESLILNRPECLSPNVVLRPLYQEYILPNLAYVGGPSELVYWMQLKGIFDKTNTAFPILLPRNFALIIPSEVERKRKKTDIQVEDLFNGADTLVKETILEKSNNTLALDQEYQQLDNLFDRIAEMAGQIDETLIPNVNAQRTGSRKSLESIEKKFIRAEKKNQETLANQIHDVHASLFPGNQLQERYANFLNFYQTDPEFIDHLMNHFNPFDFRFNILTYGD